MGSINTIAAIKEGDAFIFSELFNDYHQKVYFYILSKSHSQYIAEETTQLTFIKLWKYRASLDESLPISQQVFRIAKTTFIDLLRKEAVQAKLLQSQPGSASAWPILHRILNKCYDQPASPAV